MNTFGGDTTINVKWFQMFLVMNFEELSITFRDFYDIEDFV